MVIEDTSSLVRIISEAVKGSGERVILQSNWSTFCNSTDHIDDSIYFAGSGIATYIFAELLILAGLSNNDVQYSICSTP